MAISVARFSSSRKVFGAYSRRTLLVQVGESPQVASRVAWVLTYGDPGSAYVLHRCDNPPCCNPAHLFLGTHEDNMADTCPIVTV